MVTHVLFETASGYAIFKAKFHEDIAAKTRAMQESITDFSKFSKMVDLVSFSPFKSAAQALENANDISEGIVNDHLASLLELNLSKPSKKSSVVLAVSDSVLAGNIKQILNIECDISNAAQELLRGIRLHAPKLLKVLQDSDIVKAQLGLGHSYSRAKLKFNVNRIDNMIIQAIALLDQLDKDVNLFSMRIREWYGYHFPELVQLVPDNHQYARVSQYIGDKDALNEDKLPGLSAILDSNTTLAQSILDASRGSMGSSLSEIDMLNISAFATRLVSITEYKKSLTEYLSEKMVQVAPSLTALLGERIGARLISHAGSLVNLSKYPASTVQILGAEKALFRALKTKGNTPKYGLLYHSTFIGKAGPRHKGRISRFLANKCSIASRIDCYSENPTSKFGEVLKAQVEERLKFFETGAPPSKNADVMRKAIEELAIEEDEDDVELAQLPRIEPSPPIKGKKKRKADAMDVDEGEEEEAASKKVKLSKEEKKALKKAKKELKEAKRKSKEDSGMQVEASGRDESEREKEAKSERKKKKHKQGV